MIFIAATGAGAGAQQHVWQVPGCSSWFAGACFPYSREELADFIGYEPERSCCEDVALEMAMIAYQRAWRADGVRTLGVGLTAAVASKSIRKGANRIHAAVVHAHGAHLVTETLDDGVGFLARVKHGSVADHWITRLLEEPARGTDYSKRALELFFARPFWTALGERKPAKLAKGRPLFPGAFNPPTDAHRAIIEATNAVPTIEAYTPHKPGVSLAALLERAKLLRGVDRLFTEYLPLYVHKSKAWPGHPLVLGADALLRMLDPKWGLTPEQVMYQFAENDTKLMVFGRLVDGKWVSAEEAISMVPESGSRFDLVPLQGRWDVSSTQLRCSGS